MISDLLALIPPPANPVAPGTVEDWAFAEVAMEFRFPDDLKAIDRHYGNGWFDDFFLVFGASPAARPNPIYGYRTDLKTIFDGWRMFSPSTAPDAAHCRLIPIMNTVNGDEIFYLFDDRTGAVEVSVHASRTCVGTRYDSDTTKLLTDLLSARIRDEAFPPLPTKAWFSSIGG